MLPSSQSLVLLGLVASFASAGTLSVPFHRRHGQLSASPLSPILRRDRSVNIEAINNITGGGYYAELGIGTPPQNMAFLLDTGSSDTWVNSVTTDLCNSFEQQARTQTWCQRPFNPSSSSTYSLVARGGFDITYLDQKNIEGDYFNDTVTIGDKQVHGQQLGLAIKSTRQSGIMGLGFRANVASHTAYPTIVDNMVEQGVINAPIFSLFLDNIDDKSGTILFGGIDSQKYHGKLATLPIMYNPQQTVSRNITSYMVRLRGFNVDGVDLDRLDAGAILDSGSTISLMPDSQVQDIYRHFGVRTVEGIPTPLVDCAYRDAQARGITFNFKFDGKTIQVPIKEMVIDAFPDDIQRLLTASQLAALFRNWSRVCIFGIGSTYDYGITSDSFALLGDTFLRSAYVVYDMGNHQIGLAQANVKSDGSNIIEISKDATELPNVEGVPGTGQENAARPIGPSSIGVLVAAALTIAAAIAAPL
ncbi:hypothetical protein HIM_05723 [Hirsutella minnesotensis 3608]|uniref:Peptidase A1 domain-containing protein n=1 Tax=Hirsutella minnesotensis 3608 TaxID=1043627 RepID=A0A0F7ZQV0_9HYPO|nr:hypothetical protein HIM_12108 [Hirsutella minnesotensis 3608]KJZ74814.1 hypothetical protein HIM_05723 [Hirsutella minnesotensis 3608]